LYAFYIVSNWWAFLSIANSFGASKAVEMSDVFYQIILIIIFLYVMKKARGYMLISVVFGLYTLFLLPNTGLDVFIMSWYSILQGAIQAFIFNFCTYMIPIVSAIGLIIWYSDRNKKVNVKLNQ